MLNSTVSRDNQSLGFTKLLLMVETTVTTRSFLFYFYNGCQCFTRTRSACSKIRCFGCGRSNIYFYWRSRPTMIKKQKRVLFGIKDWRNHIIQSVQSGSNVSRLLQIIPSLNLNNVILLMKSSIFGRVI